MTKFKNKNSLIKKILEIVRDHPSISVADLQLQLSYTDSQGEETFPSYNWVYRSLVELRAEGKLPKKEPRFANGTTN